MGDVYKGKDSAPAINMKKQSSVPPELGPQWTDEHRLVMQRQAMEVLLSMDEQGLLPAPEGWATDGAKPRRLADLYADMLGLPG